jgi:L-threonylcarbamoyladenylate synthase
MILSVDNPLAISEAVKIIAKGGIIAFPTDTIYGVAGDVFNPKAIEKIYLIKERSMQKAIPVLIGDIQHLECLVSEMSDKARKLAETFWPGPLTLILPKNPALPETLSPYPTIGVRMPDHQFTLALLRATGPLATTSANISGDANPTKSQDVLEQLGGKIDLLLDGGDTPGSTASTVVDTSGPELKILREGPISLEHLNALLSEDAA